MINFPAFCGLFRTIVALLADCMINFEMAFSRLVIILIIITISPTYSSSRVPLFPRKFTHRNLQQQYKYDTNYFYQTLDHFSFSKLPNFPRRYLINSHHWLGTDSSSPIFFYCGNEGDIFWFAENTGFLWEIAPRFGALIVFLEHRYYGESMPYGSRDIAYSNATTLAYLTAEQALADFALLVTDLKRNLSAEGCPVVLFGGSFSGMLAAWMRLKYPHVAIGALASSAPILQFEDIMPPETFNDIVSSDFKVFFQTYNDQFSRIL